METPMPSTIQSFNSTLVQLKVKLKTIFKAANKSFNSTLVQLKVIKADNTYAYTSMFQFYLSSIKSTMVRNKQVISI